MRNNLLFVFLCMLLSFSLAGLAQEQKEISETSSDVPELFSFHDVIYPIWHTAFPNKDIEMLKGYVDEVNSGSQKIFEVELPGILRDKEGKWKEGVEKLRISVEKYNKAAEGSNDKEMLDAAEALHADYEMLVRIIRPMSKEIDNYHQTLYMIYHYYYPEKDFEKLKEASLELFAKAEILKTADVPRRAAKKKDEYINAVNNLFEATKKLKLAAENNEMENIDDLVEEVHTKYQNLEHIF